ncbi:tetratricopeptide repeat protein [Sphingomonas aerolata]|uniref:tetratricopeptide repeat protein n=1 Tax=Sphingomonas aerolata TaxID=185951 RepID=UPI002FDF16FD
MRAKIERALAGNAIAQAAKFAETALARGDADPMILNLVAWRREEAGDYAGAHRLLRQALALAPGDPLILAAIGTVLRKEGLLDEALAVLDAALAAAPFHAATWLERGYALMPRAPGLTRGPVSNRRWRSTRCSRPRSPSSLMPPPRTAMRRPGDSLPRARWRSIRATRPHCARWRRSISRRATACRRKRTWSLRSRPG